MTDTPDAGSQPKVDVAAEFKKQPMVDKLLLVAAAVYLLAFIVENRWKALFKFGSQYYRPWEHTLGFVGALVVLALVVTKLLGVKLVDAKLHVKLLVLAAVLPAVGLAIEFLREFWQFLMLVAILTMAYAGAKISTRDQVLK